MVFKSIIHPSYLTVAVLNNHVVRPFRYSVVFGVFFVGFFFLVFAFIILVVYIYIDYLSYI